jgi:hypothetical protein
MIWTSPVGQCCQGKYVKQAVADVETKLEKVDQCLPTCVSMPLSQGYRPELDQSRELDVKGGQYYQSLIGVLRWICELGRVDILVAVSMLSCYIVSPREGHLQQVFHLFAYLKHHKRSRMIIDDTEPLFNDNAFCTCDWTEFYPDAEEAIPHNVPEASGNGVVTSTFVDADHAGCKATRGSHTGVMCYVNKAPVLWYSKWQNTVETLTFGSEYCAMKTAIDMIEGLRYNLRMMGIPLQGPTSVFCDNQSVVKNTMAPESVLKRDTIQSLIIMHARPKQQWYMLCNPSTEWQPKWKPTTLFFYTPLITLTESGALCQRPLQCGKLGTLAQ